MSDAMPDSGDDGASPASDRVRVRRGAIRAEYDRAAIFEVLDAGLIAHVGVTTDSGPIVLPMAYGRTDDWLYVHGSAANAALRAAAGCDVCVTITIVDGIVVGRSPFHNSMNYRGVVVRGTARLVDDLDEHIEALRLVSDHVVATWDTGRPPTELEIRKTMVIAVPLVEMSAKIRTGDPIDESGDLGGPHWGGHVPIRSVWEAAVPARHLPDGIDVPAAIASLGGRLV
jgi:nitroimidazol reductase NimA-like FMN-containing flavoprotein (pyridoxamine 5'-phosphate oxidase superfamily)